MKDTKKMLQEKLTEISKKYSRVNIFLDGMNHYIRSFSTTYGLVYSPENKDISAFYYSVKHLALFMKMIEKIFDKHDIYTHIIVEHGKSPIMKDILSEYKTNRKYKPALTLEEEEKKDAFFNNIELFVEFLKKLSPFIKTYNLRNVEGDFVIAYLYYMTRNVDTLNIIVSTDKDFYQLLKNDDIIIINPYLNKIITQDVFNKHLKTESLDVNNIIPYKILIGDKSDNIKGITGPKTAEKIIHMLEEYSNEKIDNVEKLISITKRYILENKKYYKVLDKIVQNEEYLSKVNNIVNLSERNVLQIIDSKNISEISAILHNDTKRNNYTEVSTFLEKLNVDFDFMLLVNNYLLSKGERR